MKKNENKTLTGLAFSNSTNNHPVLSMYQVIDYTLYFNSTAAYPFAVLISGASSSSAFASFISRGSTVNQLLQWQAIIDNAICKYLFLFMIFDSILASKRCGRKCV